MKHITGRKCQDMSKISRSQRGRCRGTDGNSPYIFSAEKCTFIIKYSKVWKWCRTFSANFFDLNVRHLTCLRSFCVEHSGQLPLDSPLVSPLPSLFCDQRKYCPLSFSPPHEGQSCLACALLPLARTPDVPEREEGPSR